MRLILNFLLLILGCSFTLKAQEVKPNSVYVEAGGNGGWYSLNYERSFSKGLVARIGFAGYEGLFAIPVSFGKVFGENNNHLELTAGLTYVNYEIDEDDGAYSRMDMVVAIPFLGYRFQKPSGKFIFRAGLTPHIVLYNEDFVTEGRYGTFRFSAGISFGYRF